MRALIDGDILVYRVGWTTQDQEEWVPKYRIDEMIKGILIDLGYDEYKIYLSDSTLNGFRYRLWNDYKANRKDQPKPKYYELLRETLIREYGGILTPEQEADDALGIAQDAQSCIVTIDKDLDQIPGWHFNFVKKHLYHIDEWEGLRWFYKQLAMGDITENIKGIPGLGSKKADKLLEGAQNEHDLFCRVAKAYTDWTEDKELGLMILRLYGVLLKIRRKEDEIWTFPVTVVNQYPEPPLEAIQSLSIPQKLEAGTPSTVPIGQEQNG